MKEAGSALTYTPKKEVSSYAICIFEVILDLHNSWVAECMGCSLTRIIMMIILMRLMMLTIILLTMLLLLDAHTARHAQEPERGCGHEQQARVSVHCLLVPAGNGNSLYYSLDEGEICLILTHRLESFTNSLVSLL